MKTVQDFIKETEGNTALKNELKAINEKDALADFLKKNGVDATVEEFAEALKASISDGNEGEISDDAAEAVAGGIDLWPFDKKWWPWK
jgi:hypothetical protein